MRMRTGGRHPKTTLPRRLPEGGGAGPPEGGCARRLPSRHSTPGCAEMERRAGRSEVAYPTYDQRGHLAQPGVNMGLLQDGNASTGCPYGPPKTSPKIEAEDGMKVKGQTPAGRGGMKREK